MHIMLLISPAKHCVSAHYHQLWQLSVPGGSERAWRVLLQVEAVPNWLWTELLKHPNTHPVCRGTLLLNLQTFWKLQTSQGDRFYVCVSSKMERKREEKRGEKLSVFLFLKLFRFRNTRMFPKYVKIALICKFVPGGYPCFYYDFPA